MDNHNGCVLKGAIITRAYNEDPASFPNLLDEFDAEWIQPDEVGFPTESGALLFKLRFATAGDFVPSNDEQSIKDDPEFIAFRAKQDAEWRAKIDRRMARWLELDR